jgi:hypothetical protein
VAIVGLWVGTLWAATTFGETGERISATGILAGPTATVARSREVTRLVTLRPIDFYAPLGSVGVRALTRYVLECTRPSDRVLTGAFEPQVFFYAERPFAGGQVYLRAGWHGAPEDQQLTIARMRRRRCADCAVQHGHRAGGAAGLSAGLPVCRGAVSARHAV